MRPASVDVAIEIEVHEAPSVNQEVRVLLRGQSAYPVGCVNPIGLCRAASGLARDSEQPAAPGRLSGPGDPLTPICRAGKPMRDASDLDNDVSPQADAVALQAGTT